MGRSEPVPPELRERAVRMVVEVAPEYPSQWAAITGCMRALRVRALGPGASARAHRGLPGCGRARHRESPWALHDAHRPTRTRHRDGRYRLAGAQPALPGPRRPVPSTARSRPDPRQSRTNILTWAVPLPGCGPTGLRASDPTAIQLQTGAVGAIITG